MRTTGKTFPLSNSKDLDPLLERIGSSRIVMLGEASHGTHEYYTWRSAITKKLIGEKGFNLIAVEGDWPDCYRVNRYIRGYDEQDKEAAEVLKTFNRWPTWMWANWEMASLVSWLKEDNSKKAADKRTGFYGLDVYSLWESMEMLISYLENNDPPVARIAEKAMQCFQRAGKDEKAYAINSLSDPCRQEVAALLREIREKAPSYNHDPEAALNTAQNAYIISEAERYYSSMVTFNDESWNIRDRHMMETLNRVMEFHGPDTKVIIWEHNTHIGDARYTDMKHSGTVNTGQLAREQYGEEEVVLVGMGSYEGKVIAGRNWGTPEQEMSVPEATEGSWEAALHAESPDDRMIIFDRTEQGPELVFPHRAIGVVYHPEFEQRNYVPSVIDRRYDAFIYIDRTKALHSLHVSQDSAQVPETYPFEF
ncbi:MAG: erythromycin esterase family protein [Bacteroidetes bacterium]|nr:erythromycin esterase family protein [Bacteroidota bacterium]